MNDLFIRAFERPGPSQDSLVIHKTRAEFEAAAKAGGFEYPERVRAFFDPKEQKLHLPPGAEKLTLMHEALHFAGRQSGVLKALGRYLEEGLTEWLARLEFGPRARRVYEQNVAFVERLAQAVGEDTLRNAYLHGQWDPLHTRLTAWLGSEEKVETLYHLFLQIDKHGHDRIPLDEATELLWPSRAPGGKPPTSSPPATGKASTADPTNAQRADDDETVIDVEGVGNRRFRAEGPLEAHRAKFLDRNRKGWERPDAVKLDPERFEDLGDKAIPQGWTKGEGACRLLKDKSTDEIWLFKAEIDETEDIVGDGMPLDSYPRRAVAGEVAARRTGMFTPEVHLVEWNGSRGSMQRWVNGAVTLSELQEQGRAGMALYRRIIASPEFVRLRNRLKAFDYLAQNLDRSDGNFLIVLGDTGRLERLIPIDHDRVFSAMHERLLIGRVALPAKYSRVTYHRLKDMELDPEGLAVALRGVLYDDEVAHALDRLKAIIKDIEDKLERVGEAGTFLD